MARSRSTKPGNDVPEAASRILVYSNSKESLEDYAISLRHVNVAFDSTTILPDAKDMLRTGKYNILLADVTDFETTGKGLIRWSKCHLPHLKIRTHGYTRTDLPSQQKRIYARGVDQRFGFEHTDIDRMTDIIFSILLDHPSLKWANDMVAGQKNLRNLLKDKCPMAHPVLLNGAKGMGKECLAQIVHGMCNRSEHDFIILDCNPRQKFDYARRENRDTFNNRDLLKANFLTMFGKGYNGTVYFRSFYHMSLMAQEVLADVLEKGMCTDPITLKEKKFHGRVIFANNKSLPELVKKKKVSPRLYKMLAPYSMDISPVAHYGDEIIGIAQAIVDYFCIKGRGKTMSFSKEARKIIVNYSWPGNIEEMISVLEKAVETADNLVIDVKDLELINPHNEEIETYEVTDENIKMLMKKHNGNKSRVSTLLGISRGHFYKLLSNIDLNEPPRVLPLDKEEKMDA